MFVSTATHARMPDWRAFISTISKYCCWTRHLIKNSLLSGPRINSNRGENWKQKPIIQINHPALCMFVYQMKLIKFKYLVKISSFNKFLNRFDLRALISKLFENYFVNKFKGFGWAHRRKRQSAGIFKCWWFLGAHLAACWVIMVSSLNSLRQEDIRIYCMLECVLKRFSMFSAIKTQSWRNPECLGIECNLISTGGECRAPIAPTIYKKTKRVKKH